MQQRSCEAFVKATASLRERTFYPTGATLHPPEAKLRGDDRQIRAVQIAILPGSGCVAWPSSLTPGVTCSSVLLVV